MLDASVRRELEILRASRRRSSARLATDAELGAALASVDDLAFISGPPGTVRTTLDYMRAVFSRYADRPCLGERRAPKGATTDLLPAFRTVRYADVWARASALAAAFAHERMVGPGDYVTLAGFASIDLVVAELACLQRGAIVVPLQPSAAPEDLVYIATETAVRWLVCSRDVLREMTDALAPCATIAGVVLIDDYADNQGIVATPPHWRVKTIEGLEVSGAAAGLVDAVVLPDDPTIFMLYTSGSTGRPKGVRHSDSGWQVVLRESLAQRRAPVLTVGYLPLCHLAGHHSVFQVLMRGGTTFFVPRRDMSTLLDDLRLARPTTLTLIPRVSALIHQHFMTELARRAGLSASVDSAPARALMAELRETMLGDRLAHIDIGMAPTPPEVRRFLEDCFETPIVDVYGSTELGAVMANGHILPRVEYKLADVPELGYRTSDQPYPRGELLVRSPRIAPGIPLDADGYVCSGDIVEERGPRFVVWIDRKNNVLRLANGEFVALSRLEDLYSTHSPLISQIYLYGNAKRSYLLVVIVPDRAAAIALHSADAADEPVLRTLLRSELERVARDARLPAHEVPRELIIEPPFTLEEGLLTESGKPRRPALRARYGPRLEALYAELEARQHRDVASALRADDASIADTLRALLAAVLGLGSDALHAGDDRTSFVGLGGDSLSAVRFCALLEQATGVALPVAVVLDRSTSVSQLARAVEERVGRTASLSFEAVHGRDARFVRAAELAPERFFSRELGEVAAPPATPNTIVLTGATGFIGRFVLLELLARLAPRRGEVICVVRGADDASARARLHASFSHGDPSLLVDFDAVADRITVVAGDVMKPAMGLGETTYEALCERADAVVHAGALVNHALSYPQLFEPNLIGTVEAVRLALRRRRKPFHFVSSTSVVSGLRRDTPLLESERASSLWPARALGGGDAYAIGYGTSKWAAEVLLERVSAQAALPVSVYRCGIALPHRRYRGQINEDDLISRLVRGIADTGLAPTSFFAPGVAAAPFDGLPVDHVAGAIAALALGPTTNFALYHLVQTRPDAPSLDQLIDWIAVEHPLQRLDYSEWFEKFRARLETLDEAQRRRSPLPALHAWAAPIEAQPPFDDRELRRQLRALGIAESPRADRATIVRLLGED